MRQAVAINDNGWVKRQRRMSEMSLCTCTICCEDFLTEADPYVVLPKPSGVELICAACYNNKAYAAGYEAAKQQA